MRLDDAIDLFITDWRADGQIRSPHTERAYRECLDLLAEGVGNRDPSKIGKRDLTRFLARWEHPNTRRQKLAILRSFFKFCVWEDYCTVNVAERVRQPRPRRPTQTRLTREEAVRMIQAADPVRRDRWAIRIMLLAGIRNQEIAGDMGRLRAA